MAGPPPPPPGPERDRRLAAQPRYRARKVEAVADLVSSFMGSEAAKQMRRYTRVAAALNQTFAPEVLAKLKPVALAAGVLTLEVADGPLLAELRQHRAHELQSALIATGSGVTKVIWRLRRAR